MHPHSRSVCFGLVLALLVLVATHASASVSGDVVVPGTALVAPGEQNVMHDLAAAACALGRTQLENISSVLGGAGVSAVVITCAVACVSPA
jgi:hypothetical protein